MYKPSRVTVEYYSNNADTMSPTQSCASPERRSVKDARQQSGFGSPRRSIPLSPKRPSTPLSARSPTSIRSQLSSLSRKFRKEALLSDDELRISATKSPKIEESDQKKKYEPPAPTAATSPRVKKYTPVTSKGRIGKKAPVTSVPIERNANKLPVLVPSGSINSTEKDRYEMAESNSKHTRNTPPGVVEMKGVGPNRPSVYDCVGMSTSNISRQEAGVFTDGDRTFATDTYADGTFDQDTFSFETTTRKRSFLHYRFSKTLSDGSSLGDGSIIIRQQVAWGCIFLSAAQFALLTTQVLMCGIAKLNINPTIGPYPDAFSEWGGKNVYLLVEEEQYFRLITPIFLHVGYLHLFVNAFFQLETCAYLEREWGFSTWISIYLLSGFGSCLAASASDPNIIGVCSSGALMGLFGARIAQAIIWSSFQPRHEYLGQGALIFERLGGIVCSASIVFFLTFLTYIDWSGHLGGFTTGFLAGMTIFPHAVKGGPVRATLRFIGLLGMLVGGMVLGIILFHYTETDEELADACDYFRNLYAEGYNCECQAFD